MIVGTVSADGVPTITLSIAGYVVEFSFDGHILHTEATFVADSHIHVFIESSGHRVIVALSASITL